MLGVQLRRWHGSMLLFQLASTLALLSFNPLALLQREHLLVLDPQLTSLQLKVIKMLNHHGGLLGCGEVGKRQASEDTMIKVIVEGVGQRQTEVGHELHQLLLLDREGDVLDDDGRRDELLLGLGSEGL